MLIEVVHQALRTLRLDLEHGEALDACAQQRMSHGSARTTCTHLHHMLAWRLVQPALETFGKTQTVGVVPDALSVLEDHGVDRADAACFIRQFVQ